MYSGIESSKADDYFRDEARKLLNGSSARRAFLLAKGLTFLLSPVGFFLAAMKFGQPSDKKMLHISAENGLAGLSELFLSLGANPNKRSFSVAGYRPLDIAIRYDEIDVAASLLRHGAGLTGIPAPSSPSMKALLDAAKLDCQGPG